MSTATVPSTAVAPANQPDSDRLIEERIAEARNALWWAEFVRESLRTLIGALTAVIIWVIVDQWFYSPGIGPRFVAFAALVAWCVWRLKTRIWPLIGSSIQPAYAARSLERDLPDLKQSLTSYVTLRDVQQQSGLRSRVVRSIGSRVAGRLKSHEALPGEATGTLKWWLAAIATLAILFIYAAFSPKNTLASVSRLVAPLASIQPPKRVSIGDVRPGDTDALAGRSVQVSAIVDGLNQDERVWCRWRTAADLQEVELQIDESQQRFTGAIDLDHSAMGRVAYHIEAGDANAGPFWLSVENVPVVALQSVRYEPPAYTGEVAHSSSSGAITAVDGTNVTIRAATNRAIERASIEFNPRLLGQTVHATAGSKPLEIDESAMGLSAKFRLRSARGRSSAVQLESYRIVVTDASGQTNPDPIIYPIRVIADLPPEVSIVMPRKTPKNLPIDGQQVIEVHAMDPDFGLKQVTLEVRRGIDLISEPSLWSDPNGLKGNRVTEYRFRPTEHGLRIGDVVKIAAVATDNRYVAEDASIEPNIARTDAIELRIVDREPLPQQPDGNDGLSAPDDRPASDDKGDQQSQSESATDNQGQSDQQKGGGGGEGSAAQKEGDSGDGTESGESGKSGKQTDSGKTGENSQPQNGSGAGGEKDSGKGTASPQNGEPNQGDPNGQSDPNNADSPNQSPSGSADNQTPADAQAGDAQAGDAQAGDAQAGDAQAGQPGGESTQDPNANATDKPADGIAGESSQGADPSNDGSQQPNGQPGSDQKPAGDGSESAADAPPKHDGDTFERIRDFLEKKKQELSEGSGQQGQQPKDQGSQSSPTQRPENEKPGDAGSEQQPTDRTETGDRPGGDQQQGAGSKDGRKENGSQQKADPGDQAAGSSAENQQPTDGQSTEQKDSPGKGADSEPKPGSQDSASGKQDGTAKPPDGSESSTADQDRGDGTESGDQTGKGSPQDSGQEPGKDVQSKADQEARDKGKGDQQSGDADQGKGDTSKTGQGSDASTDPSGDSSKGGSDNSSESKDSPSKDSQQSSKDSQQSSKDSPRDGSQSNPSASGQSQKTGDPSSNSSTPPQGTPTQASGDGSGTEDGGQASPPPPAKPDLEYTKKATDMVLDYLKETRDKPDSELLEKLNWTEDDLKRFADRWQKVRDLQQPGLPDGDTNQDVEEALRSLGMRPQAADAALQNRDKADRLRGIRDSGNRKPPPAAHRDLFDAFRRAMPAVK